ncbi:MAG: triose-phosphate isomerase [bacterium]
MRKPFIAGNWKLNLTSGEAVELAKKVADAAAELDIEVGIAPVYTVIPAVREAIKGSGVHLMAQNLFWEDSGAYTGEVSAPMLKDAGCTYVIIGHSERRQYFNETDETVNKRLKAALSHGLTPIVCIGETLEEREADRTMDVIERQVKGALQDIEEKDLQDLVMAYEPVWAIGTGKTATSDQAQEVHARIRDLIKNLYSDSLAEGMRIQYGGSVKPENVSELMGMQDIDGALVGGASLKADKFIPIIQYK